MRVSTETNPQSDSKSTSFAATEGLPQQHRYNDYDAHQDEHFLKSILINIKHCCHLSVYTRSVRQPVEDWAGSAIAEARERILGTAGIWNNRAGKSVAWRHRMTRPDRAQGRDPLTPVFLWLELFALAQGMAAGNNRSRTRSASPPTCSTVDLAMDEYEVRNAIIHQQPHHQGLKALVTNHTAGDILLISHSTSGELSVLAYEDRT